MANLFPFGKQQPGTKDQHSSGYYGAGKSLLCGGSERPPGNNKRCHERTLCSDEQKKYQDELRPVCPVFQREFERLEAANDLKTTVPESAKTGSIVINSIIRVLMALESIIKLRCDEQTIVYCAHNKGFVERWYLSIFQDIRDLPQLIEPEFPNSSKRLESLFGSLALEEMKYKWNSDAIVYLMPPDEVLKYGRPVFEDWQNGVINGAKFCDRIEDGKLTCTYPARLIKVAEEIRHELKAPLKRLWYDESRRLEEIRRSKKPVQTETPTKESEGSVPEAKDGRGKGIIKDEANVRVRQLLTETPTWDWSTRKLAKQVHCGHVLISYTPAYIAYNEKRKELRHNKTIDTVRLSDELEAVIGEGKKDEVLKQLIADQEGEEREDARQAKLYLNQQRKPKRRTR